jgi:DNA polymerase III alpha subunit
MSGNYYIFPCGCKIPIVDGSPKIDFKNVNLKCQKTWQIYKDGQTRSIFQLESFLGKRWSKILKPNCIADAAALISIIRPGVLETKDENNTSLTEVFCNRKNGKWGEMQSDSILDILLSSTYGINIYQETSMLIAREVAGFDGVQSMKLIKSIGKKNAELLFSLRKDFISGCLSLGKVNEAEANILFDNIEASARYAFNKSHAFGYAETGYWTAWVKAHLPYHYICAWLRNANSEPKPLEEIKVAPPSISNMPNTNFFIKNKVVYFGLDSIKSCGEKTVKKLLESLDSTPDSWVDFLVMHNKSLNKKELISMIRTGAFDYLGESRGNLENQYNQFLLLKNSEKKLCKDLHEQNMYMCLADLIDELSKIYQSKKPERAAELSFIVESCRKNYIDQKSNIVAHERELLGINVSCSNIERSSIPDGIHKTKSVSNSAVNTELVLVGEISDYREIKIKNGKNAGQLMATFALTDEVGQIECVVYSKELDFYQGAIYDGNIIMIKCKKSSRGGVIISKIFEV